MVCYFSWFTVLRGLGVVNLKALIYALSYKLAWPWCLSRSPVQPIPIKFCMHMFRRGEENSMAQESGLQLYRRWTFSSDGEIEEFKCDMTSHYQRAAVLGWSARKERKWQQGGRGWGLRYREHSITVPKKRRRADPVMLTRVNLQSVQWLPGKSDDEPGD